MATFPENILIYLVVINVVTFFTFGIDKLKGKHAKWRIREASLLALAVLGGRFWTMEEIHGAIGKEILTPNFESEFMRFLQTR